MSEVCVLQRRLVNDRALSSFESSPGLSKLEARLLASRGDAEKSPELPQLLQTPMRDVERAAKRLHEAIDARQLIVVVADYDCDGATACATAVAGLRAMGANVGYVVPDRMVHGYGISPSVVDFAREKFPQAKVLVTVDNGILGHAGITYAAGLGLDVVVTDHHLPGDTIPDAVAVIDPARDDCPSGLRKLAGVGVSLWLLVALKKLRAGLGRSVPSLNFLLPYVAIGTVADMVGLDAPNRRLVATGMERMRAGQAPVGVLELIKESGFVPAYMTTQDIGFSMGPRINAAGRLDTMDAGIELLLAEDPKVARKLAKILTETNEERKRLQKEATQEASMPLEFSFDPATRAIVKASHEWHPGIIGLVASRLKDKYFRPVFVVSLVDGLAKGSGRSIPGFHLKDALEEVARRAPGVLSKFGGHAMAAGATLTSPEAVETFSRAFSAVAAERITPEMLQNVLWSDGEFPDLTVTDAARILRHPWGQGFEPPAFDSLGLIKEVTPLGGQGLHWRAKVLMPGRNLPTQVVMFNQPEPKLGNEAHLYLQPGFNTWKGKTDLQWQARILGS